MVAFDILVLNDLSRLILALACVASAIASGSLAHALRPKYLPHLLIVTLFSVWAAAAMLALAFDQITFPLVDDRLIIINLNQAFTVTVAGWALLAARMWLEARRTVVIHVAAADEVLAEVANE